MKVLFIVPYPTKAPSNRFRVEQYLPLLRKQGINFKLEPFQTDQLYEIIHLKGKHFRKAILLLQCAAKRLLCIVKIKKFDIIFIHREVFPVLGWFSIKLIYLLNKNIIYDFDDSLFLYNADNILLRFLKQPSVISEIIKLSKYVVAGNGYLASYALKFNRNVLVIPTPIDTEKFIPGDKTSPVEKTIIGWVGSRTTSGYLNMLTRVFEMLLSAFPNTELHVIGGNYQFSSPRIIKKAWCMEEEIKNLQTFDIGIMPLEDDEWGRGKCAFKIIQYMSVGIPVVASPVGMNREVVKDGCNGFFAENDNQWFERISTLVRDKELRRRMGQEGRKLVEENYSLKVHSKVFIEVLKKVHYPGRK